MPSSIKLITTKTFATLALIMAAASLLAQSPQNFTATGKITNEDNEPVEAATVMLMQASDSTLVQSTTTNKAGRFVLQANKSGNYIVKVSFVGCITVFEHLQMQGSKKTYDLGVLTLLQDSKIIGEATVVAEAPPVTVKGDTIIYSAAAIRLHEGAMLEDLIKKIPGAEIDSDGNITLNGKEITSIMVDGKEFFTNDPNIALKNLPANVVKDVKTYDRKSEMTRTTGIEDGEEVNVLDVTIKEGMKAGWFGNIAAGGGTKGKYETNAMANTFKGDMHLSLIGSANNINAMGGNSVDNADISAAGRGGMGETKSQSIGADFSLNKKDVEVHADISYNRRDQYTDRKESKETFLLSGSTYDLKNNINNNISNSLQGSFRLKWELDDKTTLMVNQNANYGDKNSHSSNNSTSLDEMLDSINTSTSTTETKGQSYMLNGNMILNRKLGKTGRNLTLQGAYEISDNNDDEITTSETFFFENDSTSLIDRLTNNTSRTASYSIGLAYSEPLWKDTYMSIGYEFRQTKSSSLREPVYDNSSESNAATIENETYNYKTQHTMKFSLQSTINKLFYNIGIDFAPLESRTKVDRGTNAGLDKSQTSMTFQPRAIIVLRMDKTRQLHISYRGSTTTPSILDLQEIKDISDPMNISYGNPNLKNSFRNMARINFVNYNPDKGSSMMVMASANNTINGITQRTTFDTSTGARTTRSENINGNWGANLNFTFTSPLKNKKFTLGTSLSSNYTHRVGYSSMTSDTDISATSKTNNAILGNKVFATYKHDNFDIMLQTVFDANITRNNLNETNNRTTYNYGLNADININLPWDLYFSTSASYNGLRGYSDGYDDDYVLWNAQLSKIFLKKKQATIRIKAYDLLQNQKNTFRTMSYDYTLDTETNVIGSYVIFQFIYRFNTIGGNHKDRGRQPGGRRPERGSGGMMNYPPPMRMDI